LGDLTRFVGSALKGRPSFVFCWGVAWNHSSDEQPGLAQNYWAGMGAHWEKTKHSKLYKLDRRVEDVATMRNNDASKVWR
jgi:hypothetical protein